MIDKSSIVSDIERFLNIIWLPSEVCEFRIPHYNKYRWTASGYFENPIALANTTTVYDGTANLYVNLNPVNPTFLAFSELLIERRRQDG